MGIVFRLAWAAWLAGGIAPIGPLASAAPSPAAWVAKTSPQKNAHESGPTYKGHGAQSVPPEVLTRFRPLPLPPAVARRIQSLLDIRAPSIGALSPDGKSMFFHWTVTGVPQIWRVDGPMRFPQQLTGGEDTTFREAFTPDGKWLVVSRDRKGEENPGLYLQLPEGGSLIEIQHKPGVQTELNQVTDDSRFIYFHANDVRPDSYAIYRYDLQKRTRETVFDQPGLWSVVDLGPGGRLLLMKEKGSLRSELYEYEPSTKKLTPLIGQNEQEEYRAAYGARGELLVLTNKPGEYRRLYVLKQAKLVPLTEEMPHDVSAFSVDRGRTRILYQVNEGGFTRLRGLDAKSHKPLRLPKLPEADHVVAGETTPDGRYTTIGVDDGRHPMQSYVYDWKKGRLQQWHRPSTPEIDTTRFARAVAETYPARDGTKIPVLVRRPEKCAAEPCPVVMCFHGGPEGQALPGFSVSAELFVDAGFILVEPNVRGSDGYGKSWLHADDGPKRLQVITDIEDAATWARQRFAVSGKRPRVGIYGGSYGGYSVLMGMTRFAGAYDAGVDVVGISNLVTFLKNTAPYRRILRINEYGDPDRDAQALQKLSPVTYLDRVKAPLLILHGATDPRVPAGEAIQIHEALQKRGVTSRLMIFPDEGHGAQKRENRVLMYGHAIAFFQQHLR